MEVWVPLTDHGYPDYEISNWGQIRQTRNGRAIAQSRNTTGCMRVSLVDDTGARATVLVSRLVAQVFVPGYSYIHNTPIHLDGNKEHGFADNLAWRPRWFAIQYHRQFRHRRHRIESPIVEVTTGQQFDNSLEAARAFGVLERDILMSTANHTEVFPDARSFRLA